jgi:lipopolysaccharide transport system ATP-binding protein
MSEVILKVEHISKQYRLGLVGTGTLSHDLKRWFYKIRGKDDPFLKIGDTNDRSKAAESDYVWAIKDISFEVKRGEVLGIIGKNGAGKSTLLKILSRVTSPTTGQIKTKGRIASLLEVGTGFHPELTGKENIYLNGAILGMTKAEIKAKEQEIIEFSGCQRYIDTPVKRYSSGMRVRLAFAVAAFLEPDILVVDEVLAVGDAEFQKKAIGKMQDISKGDGRTVLFVSHNMAAVQNLCTRGLVLVSGEKVFEGSSEEAVNYYLKSAENSMGTDLLKRNDRFGSGEIKFSNVLLFNKDDERIKSIISGDYLKVRIELESRLFFDEKLVFAFSIYDIKEDLKAMIVSDEMDLDFNSIVKKGYIDIIFNQFLFRGGLYDFHFVLSKMNTNRENQIDNIRKAFQLSVLQGDVYKSGKLNRNYPAYLIPCKIV